MYTELDLSAFHNREISMMIDLLKAYRENDKTTRFNGLSKIGFNHNSGFVFLVDDDMNVAMDVNGKLEDFFTCPECGEEGFRGDFEDRCCIEALGLEE